jgi:hypothetical protein
MNEKGFLKLISTQFGYLAKSTGESLISHHYTTYCIAKRMINYIPRLKSNDQDSKLLLIATLTHDLGKKKEDNQRKLRNPQNSDRITHKLTIDEFMAELNPFKDELELSESDIKEVHDIVVGHHSYSEADLDRIGLVGAGYFTRILKTADWLSSMDLISMSVVHQIKDLFEGCFDLIGFEFSRFPSPFTCFAIEQIHHAYIKNGWEILLSLDGGSLFIGNPGTALPLKDNIVKDLYREYIQLSLKLQKPNPRSFMKTMLSGLSATHPYLYLEAHDEYIKEMLSKKEEKPLIFFKYIKDVLDQNNVISDKMRESYFILDILASTTGPRGVNDAKAKWVEKSGKKSFENLKALINDIFYSTQIGDFLPDEYRQHINRNQKLSALRDEELFQILKNVGMKYDSLDLTFPKDEEIREYLSTLISMEESQIDFKAAASKIFGRYKTYKDSPNPEKGVCERCGSPHSERMQPALGFLKGTSSSFSQIKAKYGDRATCGFCSFDNMRLRENMTDSKIPVYVKIKAKIPELIHNNDRLVDFVKDMSSDLQYADLEDMREISFMNNMPVPEDFDLYLMKSKSKKRKVEPLPIENGLYIKIDSLASSDFSPKEYRARLAPLYHLLNLTCFDASIGAEEQIGLFGENTPVSVENYYFGLAVLVLASFSNKTQGKHVFAENMLEKAPSSALMAVESFLSDKKTRLTEKAKEKRTEIFFKCISKASLKITTMHEGGDYRMEHLLRDAARLADKEKGIPHFCVEPEKRGEFYGNLTKHIATAPLSRALDELLRSGSADMATARFMEKLAVKIGKDESEEQNQFFEFVKGLIEKFKALRQENVADFIKAKNALMTATYILTRYGKLKEVIK